MVLLASAADYGLDSANADVDVMRQLFQDDVAAGRWRFAAERDLESAAHDIQMDVVFMACRSMVCSMVVESDQYDSLVGNPAFDRLKTFPWAAGSVFNLARSNSRYRLEIYIKRAS